MSESATLDESGPGAEAPYVLLLGDALYSIEVFSAVSQAAKSLRLRTELSLRTVEVGESFLHTITREIENAEIVLLFSSELTGSNLWFEAGVASALRRPTVLVRCDESQDVPSDLASFITLGPVITERGLALAMKRALRGRVTTKRLERASTPSTGRPLGNEVELWLERLGLHEASISPDPRGRYAHYEDWFADLLSSVEVPFERSVRKGRGAGPLAQIDFVVTADELSENLGAVLPVELLASRQQRMLMSTVRSRVGAFRQYMDVTGASTLLAVVLEMEDPPQLLDSWGGSVLLSSVRDLVEGMRKRTFGASVLHLRNSAVRVGEVW